MLQRPLSNANGQVIIHQSGSGYSAESFPSSEHQTVTSLSSAHHRTPTSFETDLTPLLNAAPTTFTTTDGQTSTGKFAIMLVSIQQIQYVSGIWTWLAWITIWFDWLETVFATSRPAPTNTTHFKSGQKWPDNNHIVFLPRLNINPWHTVGFYEYAKSHVVTCNLYLPVLKGSGFSWLIQKVYFFKHNVQH